jgi:hypothetical protein
MSLSTKIKSDFKEIAEGYKETHPNAKFMDKLIIITFLAFTINFVFVLVWDMATIPANLVLIFSPIFVCGVLLAYRNKIAAEDSDGRKIRKELTFIFAILYSVFLLGIFVSY